VIADVPRIQTRRLDLRPIVAGDADAAFADARDPRMYRYLQQRPPATLDDLRILYARWAGGSHDPRMIWLNWIAVERSSKERIGLLQATIDVSARTATIGYSIFARFQGRRFAREAIEAMLARLKARDDIDRAVAEISEPNVYSRAVIESLDFTVTGRISGTGREDGRICDDVVYARELRP
jgi:[ribosomal protein S5]-alanine N-acetyltransferase